MQILQFRGKYPNFGDELNSWLWPKMFPNIFDADGSTHFIGVGSTIGDAPRDASKKIVFGAGFVPHYHALPEVHDGNWNIYFVRGPRTAARLKLDPALAIGDAGILARTLLDCRRTDTTNVGFMPHWESIDRGHWQEACRLAGVTFIDPRKPVDEVFAQLLSMKCVVAEAMHGAIMADALRVPWVPLLPLNHVHRDKWYDWAEAFGLTLRPYRLWPSSLTELSASAAANEPMNGAGGAPLPTPSRAGRLSRIKKQVQATPVAPWIDRRLTELAAVRLAQLARIDGTLSQDGVMERVTNQMLEKADAFRRDYCR